jgi:hypothetical protein
MWDEVCLQLINEDNPQRSIIVGLCGLDCHGLGRLQTWRTPHPPHHCATRAIAGDLAVRCSVQSRRVVQQDAKKDRHDQREKQEVALYQMAHRCPVMDARARFHGPIGLVEIPNLIFSKLSHFPQGCVFAASIPA